jgi:hypothetical protein
MPLKFGVWCDNPVCLRLLRTSYRCCSRGGVGEFSVARKNSLATVARYTHGRFIDCVHRNCNITVIMSLAMTLRYTIQSNVVISLSGMYCLWEFVCLLRYCPFSRMFLVLCQNNYDVVTILTRRGYAVARNREFGDQSRYNIKNQIAVCLAVIVLV